jgi:hypothetical protein
MGAILGARVLGELGDDPHRYVSAKARKNYAATSPITRASGKKKVMAARFIHNAGHRWCRAGDPSDLVTLWVVMPILPFSWHWHVPGYVNARLDLNRHPNGRRRRWPGRRRPRWLLTGVRGGPACQGG